MESDPCRNAKVQGLQNKAPPGQVDEKSQTCHGLALSNGPVTTEHEPHRPLVPTHGKVKTMMTYALPGLAMG